MNLKTVPSKEPAKWIVNPVLVAEESVYLLYMSGSLKNDIMHNAHNTV